MNFLNRILAAAAALGLFAQYALAAAPELAGPPAAPTGWKIEVVAQVPQILDPTMIAVAPDGRVFIGQQTAAMENSDKKEPLDSIVVLHPDGKVTTFATGLYNLFGLAYLEGKLYVTQWPKVSVFTDDNSVGKNPVDLFELSALRGGYMQHIGGNMRYGMDGYFYMATGDRGAFKTVGTDGSKIELYGGGVVRFRPDGSHLEVFACNTRNHPDLAINAEDEIFTLDNTDDGGGWNVRLTHIVDGGVYGYPYDYKPRRPYTLWCMQDYGGGSPTGAIVYNEDALPEEYRGNLFMSEWGKRSLLRFRPQRDGATYKVPARDELINAQSGGSECRPNGLGWSPDGMSLYIADWNNGGWKQNKKVGRILKMTYIGAPSLAAVKPEWWLAAASGKPVGATIPELIAGLRHPAQSVRLTAQRQLAARGAAASKALTELLTDAKAPGFARSAALWSLDGIDGGLSARATILTIASKDADRLVRSQAIRQLGTRRAREASGALVALLKDPDAVIRFRAATALGRIADPASVAGLVPALSESDFFTRYSIFHALNLIGCADAHAWPAIAQGLASPDERIREGTLFAMRETFVEENARALAAFVGSTENSGAARASALTTLVGLYRQTKPWDGSWWHNKPVQSPMPPKVVDWEGTPVALAAVTRALQDPEPVVVNAALEALSVTRDPAAAPVLAELFARATDLKTKQAILEAVGASPGNASRTLLAGLLNEPATNPALVGEAVAAAGSLADKTLLPLVARIAATSKEIAVVTEAIAALRANPSPESITALVGLLRRSEEPIRSAAAEALGHIPSDGAFKAVLPLLDDANADVRRAAIVAVTPMKKMAQVQDKLVTALGDPATRMEAITALAQMPDPSLLKSFLSALTDAPPIADAAQKGIDAMKEKVLAELEAQQTVTPFAPAVLARLQIIYRQDANARRGPLMKGAAAPPDPKAFETFARTNAGDPLKGRPVFQSSGCVACHRAEGSGGDIGPDLTGISAKYGRDYIIESVLYPSKVILDGYQQTLLTLKNGEQLTGMVRSTTDTELKIADASGQSRLIPRSEIKTQKEGRNSLMPEGLYLSMTPQSFADLIGYLETLSEKPQPAPAK